MVLHHSDDGVLCIGQAAHARVSGDLARRWGNDRVAPPEPFDELCLGAEQHDVGMAEWDVRPEIDPSTGLPRQFFQMPLETHIGLWTAAPDKVLTQSPWAALIVSMHGQALYRERPGAPAARFVAEQSAYQDDLLARTGIPREQARAAQKLVWALDFLSLAPITGWTPETMPVPSPDGGEITLDIQGAGPLTTSVDPWPFATDEPVELSYAARRIDGPYETQEALDAALRDAPWTWVTARWVRG